MSVFWSKEDSEKGKDIKTTKHAKAFSGRCDSNKRLFDEKVSYEELAASYKELCSRSEEVCKNEEKQNITIAQLQVDKKELINRVYDLQSEVYLLTSKPENMAKSVRMLNTRTHILEEILQAGKGAGSSIGIGFKEENKASG